MNASLHFAIGIALILFVVTANGVNIFEETRPKQTGKLKGAYIVEFKSEFTRRFQKNQFDEFYRRAASKNLAIRTRMNLTSKFFEGASFYISDQNKLASIRSLDLVERVWPVSLIERPRVETHAIFNPAEDNIQPRSSQEESNNPLHAMTGVDKLHQMGYFGANVKIAILDTGIDYMHPDLGGGFGPGYKMEFGYDLVGDAYDGYNTPIPDDDPFTNCSEHGTHVAGTIGAEGKFFTGVAPNATLGIYRVFGCDGGAADDVIIAAYELAEKEGAHIITASLGGPPGWIESPLSVIADRITQSGITCLVAAGNDGDLGFFYGSSPATGQGVIAVASVDASETPLLKIEAKYKIRNRQKKIFHYFSGSRKFIDTVSGYYLATIDLSTIESNDACSPLPTDLPDLSKRILLIKFGDCDWQTQFKNLKNISVRNVMFFGNTDYSFISERGRINYGVVRKPLLRVWIGALRNGKSIRIYLYPKSPARLSYEPNLRTGGKISYFSTWYPTYDLHFKPEVAAPGGYIFSTIPEALGSYAVFSGTSMATPYAAGVAALYLSARGFTENITSSQLKNIISQTATPINYEYNGTSYEYLAPTPQQGLGLVNALALIQLQTQINISKIALNDSAHFVDTVSFTISNPSNTTVTYTLSHMGAATFNTLELGSDGLYTFSSLSDLFEDHATVSISPNSIDVGPGSTETISVQFTPPSGLNAELLPVYSGFIKITGNNQETQNIGYLGAACSMKDLDFSVNLNDSSILESSSTENENVTVVTEGQTLSFNSAVLHLKAQLVMGTPMMTIDIIGKVGNETGEMSLIGTVVEFPKYFQQRSLGVEVQLSSWNGSLTTGEILQSGSYYLLMRILKIFGDPTNTSDFYVWRSPTFIVV